MHSSKLDKQMYHSDTYTPLPFFLMRQSNKNERKEKKTPMTSVEVYTIETLNRQICILYLNSSVETVLRIRLII